MPVRERSVRVEAVVLRHTNWGEADRLLVLFTREMGKMRVVAKGVRKVQSRKAGHLEPFTRTNLQLAHGREIWLVTQAETIQPFTPLREDLMLATHAAYVVELIDRFTYEEGDHPALYRLLVETLGRLSSAPNADLVVRYYELRLLDLVGFRPQLFYCLGCQAEIKPQDQFFSAEHGGVLCPRCGANQQGVRPASMNALRFLRHFQRSTYEEAARAPLTPQLNREIENLIQYYLTYLLERGLNTPAFLRRLRRESQERDAAAGSLPPGSDETTS